MAVKKFSALTLSLGLAFAISIGSAPVGHAMNLVSIVHEHYIQMREDADLRRICLARISGNYDESFLLKYEDHMLRNPETFQRELVSKLSIDEKFRENYLEFLKGCERYKKHYEDFMSKRPRALRYPPTW